MSSTTAPETARRRWSLATRLTVWNAGFAFLLILGATAFLYWALLSNLDREDDQFLAAKVRFLRTLLRDRPDDAGALRRSVEGERTSGQEVPLFVRVLGADGRTVLETPGMGEELPPSLFPEPVPADREPG